MHTHHTTAAAVWIGLSMMTTAAELAFGPIRSQPGQSVRMTSLAECREGTVEILNDGRTVSGSLALERRRELSWTFREPAADGTLRGMVAVNDMTTRNTVRLDGVPEEIDETRSPLSGTMFAMTRPPEGEWSFELDGSIPRQRVRDEIAELKVYLQRQWYPLRTVRIGDTWEFDPVWIRHLIQRDLANAQIIGTMKLRQVRRTLDKEIAVIEVTIRSTGGDFTGDGSETHVQLELTGEKVVNLRTMLDEKLELTGTLVQTTGTLGSNKKITMPLTLKVEKTFAN